MSRKRGYRVSEQAMRKLEPVEHRRDGAFAQGLAFVSGHALVEHRITEFPAI
jgi:hypothetical protein